MHSIRYTLHRCMLLLAFVVTTQAYASVPTLTYSSSTFNESAANIGTINNSTPIIIVLSGGDTFTGSNNDDFVAGGKITVTNLPSGLTAVAARVSAETLSVTITGAATNHASANSVSNLTFAFQNSAFGGNNAGNVTNSTKNNLAVTFLDPVENALSFDGSNDVVSVPSSSSINLSQGTWEAWVKVNSLSHHNRIIFKEGADNNGKYELYILDNSFSGSIRADVVAGGTRYNAISSVNATAGTWTHIAATFDSTDIKIYVNGVLRGTTTIDGAPAAIDANTGPLGIGGGVNPTDSRFEGAIDEVRIWNIVRTASEISADMNNTNLSSSTTGLQAYYQFNHGTAGGTNTGLTTLYDATSNSNNGTLNNFALTGTSSNYIANDNTALPVELTMFAASVNSRGVELQWATATEVNNFGFEIERRAISDRHLQGDGHFAWSKVGFVEGSGTTNSPKEYSYTDKNLSNGTYSYRLKQIDRDGKFEYSQSVEVTVANAPKEFALIQNYPNPFNPTTTIQYSVGTDAHPSNNNMHGRAFTTLKIYDVLGKEVATLVNEVKEAGYYSATFDASKLSSGIYFARLQSGEKVQLKKMMLIK
ncbi:MAG: LamG-like jellyroll fold domain-containing protein [Bacteroidota bacterium]